MIFVLVGPFADPKLLARWAHAEFRKSAAVAFIGIDAGLRPLLASGLPATLAIGDMDGVGDLSCLAGASEIPIVRLERAKERSDLANALEFCVSQGAQMIYAFGFQGGRADHEFGVHLDFSASSLRVPRIVSIGEKGAIFYLSARFSPLRLLCTNIEALRTAALPEQAAPKKRQRSASLVSLFPIGSPVRGVRLRGLRFPALDGILSLSSQGLSNEIRAREIEIGFRGGRVVVFFPA